MFYIPNSTSTAYKLILSQLPVEDQEKKIYMLLDSDWTDDELLRWPLKIDRNSSWISIYMILDRPLFITPDDMTVLLCLFEISYTPPENYTSLVYQANSDYIGGYFTFKTQLDGDPLYYYAIPTTECKPLVKSEESFMSEPKWIKILPHETSIIPAASFYKIYIFCNLDASACIKFSNKNLVVVFDYKHLTALHDMMDSPYIKISVDDTLISTESPNIILQSTVALWIKPTYNGIVSTPITVLNYNKVLFSKIFMFEGNPLRYSKHLTDIIAGVCPLTLKQYVSSGCYGLFVS